MIKTWWAFLFCRKKPIKPVYRKNSILYCIHMLPVALPLSLCWDVVKIMLDGRSCFIFILSHRERQRMSFNNNNNNPDDPRERRRRRSITRAWLAINQYFTWVLSSNSLSGYVHAFYYYRWYYCCNIMRAHYMQQKKKMMHNVSWIGAVCGVVVIGGALLNPLKLLLPISFMPVSYLEGEKKLKYVACSYPVVAELVLLSLDWLCKEKKLFGFWPCKKVNV